MASLIEEANAPSQNSMLRSEENIPSYDELMERQGGFGRFQWISSPIMMMTMNLPGILALQLSYLLMYQRFDCEVLGSDKQWVQL